MPQPEENRYARQIVLPEVGSAGQRRLADARVLVVGLGGLGCPAALLLAGSGIGRLLLNDFDTIDVSNLPRQILYVADDAGQPKTIAAARRLRAINPAVDVVEIGERLTADALRAVMAEVDVVLDGTDNFAARFAVSDACLATATPLVSGAAIRLEGQIAVFRNDGNGPCYRCIYDESDEFLGDCQGNGVLAPVTAAIGAMMALAAIRLLLDLEPEQPALHLWDARSGEWNRVALKRNPNCAACNSSV
jgi:adenylyltransferase/sulfurtransferase